MDTFGRLPDDVLNKVLSLQAVTATPTFDFDGKNLVLTALSIVHRYPMNMVAKFDKLFDAVCDLDEKIMLQIHIYDDYYMDIVIEDHYIQISYGIGETTTVPITSLPSLRLALEKYLWFLYKDKR